MAGIDRNESEDEELYLEDASGDILDNYLESPACIYATSFGYIGLFLFFYGIFVFLASFDCGLRCQPAWFSFLLEMPSFGHFFMTLCILLVFFYLLFFVKNSSSMQKQKSNPFFSVIIMIFKIFGNFIFFFFTGNIFLSSLSVCIKNLIS